MSNADLRELVARRAGQRCEYCLFPASESYFSFELEHIIAEKHGGTTTQENLALACPFCNRFKGTDLGSLDPVTGQLTSFFGVPGRRRPSTASAGFSAERTP